MVLFIAWVLAQPMGSSEAWAPVLFISFGVSGVLLLGWAAHVHSELNKGRERYHDMSNYQNGLNARLYFIEQHLGLPTHHQEQK